MLSEGAASIPHELLQRELQLFSSKSRRVAAGGAIALRDERNANVSFTSTQRSEFQLHKSVMFVLYIC